MDYLISEKSVLVEGCKNAAIYDLKNNKVYKINDIAKDIINRVIVCGGSPKSTTENGYIETLIANDLYNSSFKAKEYKANTQCDIKLNFAWLEINPGVQLKVFALLRRGSA